MECPIDAPFGMVATAQLWILMGQVPDEWASPSPPERILSPEEASLGYPTYR